MTEKKSAWELESATPYDHPSLESILECISKKDKEYADEDIPYREPATNDIAINIRSLPRRVWETIRYITMKYPSEVAKLKSTVEGCLIHCGLNVVETMVKESPRGKQDWLEAYESDDEDTLLQYVNKRYAPEYLGRGISQTKKIYFLNKSDQARAMEINTTYGLSLSQVATACMIAGMAQSESVVPRKNVERAQKEMERFKKWLNGES